MTGVDWHPTGDRIEIPDKFAAYLGDVYGRDPPRTVWEWWTIEGARSAESGGMEAADFYGEARTRHEVHVGGAVRYAPCVLDALAAAAMEAHDPAIVRSTDPVTAAPITVEFTDDSVDVVPGGAVVSIGGRRQPEVSLESHVSIIDYAADADDGAYARDFCAYRNAFESEATYARWAADTDACTFPAGAEPLSALLHRLHRRSRLALVAGMFATALRERLAGPR